MESKTHTKIVITSILAFVLIVVTGISTTTFVNVFAQDEDGDTGGMTDGESNITDGTVTNEGTGITEGLTSSGS